MGGPRGDQLLNIMHTNHSIDYLIPTKILLSGLNGTWVIILTVSSDRINESQNVLTI